MSAPTPAASTPRPGVETKYFSPFADVVVVCDHFLYPYQYLVSSAALRLASPVWRVTLDPETKFAPLKKITVDGKEYPSTSVKNTKPAALTAVFNILHYKTTEVARLIDFKDLLDIAILADEYDIAKALLPWTEFWVKSFASSKSLDTGIDWMFIATVFDGPSSLNIIQTMSRQLIVDATVVTSLEDEKKSQKFYIWKKISLFSSSKETKVINGETHERIEINADLIPQKIIDSVIQEREKFLSTILGPIRKMVREMMQLTMHKPDTTVGNHIYCQNADCFAIALGSLMRSIYQQGLQDILLGENYGTPELPLGDLALKVQNLNITTLVLEFPPNNKYKYPSHRSNNLLGLDELKSLASNLPSGGLFLREYKPVETTRAPIGFGAPPPAPPPPPPAPQDNLCPLAIHLGTLQQEVKREIGTLTSKTFGSLWGYSSNSSTSIFGARPINSATGTTANSGLFGPAPVTANTTGSLFGLNSTAAAPNGATSTFGATSTSAANPNGSTSIFGSRPITNQGSGSIFGA
ncbi:hypothetical protein ABW20_dc0106529 [Dactylellina cionopaga]|nr:hypothetical protein ABW20_dc0106529 [Dactylellina cionopaga]